MTTNTFDSEYYSMLINEKEKKIQKEIEREVELKTLRDDISIIKTDVYTILYLLYNFIKKPDSMDFDTFYKSRFCGTLREKIDKVME